MARRGRGFTLIEMLGVMVIIGVLAMFILSAASGAMRAAEQESTRSLIVKLDSGLTQLVELIQNSRVEPNAVHMAWAGLYPPTGPPYSPTDRSLIQRAQIIATYDKMRAELPDVWFVQSVNLTGSNYPINFAQQPFQTSGTAWDSVLPLGSNSPLIIGAGLPQPGSGIFGASYSAAAGLYKNLGNVPSSVITTPGTTPQPLLPQGYDGTDNDGDRFVDNIFEGTQNTPNIQASVAASLAQHKHVTARSEMLYALLVEGQGQFGAIFERSEFTDKQVMDTDNDGLPEFVDAWGQPLQFFRWPIFYHSDVQRGIPTNTLSTPYTPTPPYFGFADTREQDPYDPNQQLTAVQWWSRNSNTGPASANAPTSLGFQAPGAFLSGGAMDFQRYFHYLVEPMAIGGPNPSQFWDRSANFYPRRAFYSRFLILSAGPDKRPGVPILPESQLQSIGNVQTVAWALQLESGAAQFDLLGRLAQPNQTFETPFFAAPNVFSTDPEDAINGLTFFEMGQDDITNHNLNSSAIPAAQ